MNQEVKEERDEMITISEWYQSKEERDKALGGDVSVPVSALEKLGFYRNTWRPIETAPKDRQIILAGQWDGPYQSRAWDIQIGEWLAKRFPWVGHTGPTHWAPIEPPQDKEDEHGLG